MHIKFSLSPEILGGKEKLKQLKERIKSNEITLSDIRLIVRSNIIDFYNDLIEYFNANGRKLIQNGAIYDRQIIEHYIERNEWSNKNCWKYLQICKENDLIGVCGSGYTFNYDKLSVSSEEYIRLSHLIYEKELIF